MVYHIDRLNPESMPRAEPEGRKVLSEMSEHSSPYSGRGECRRGLAFDARESRRTAGRYFIAGAGVR